MPIRIPENSVLLDIFQKKDGIFNNTSIANKDRFRMLKNDFDAEVRRITSMKNAEGKEMNFMFLLPFLPILQLKSNIEMFQLGGDLTHLSWK